MNFANRGMSTLASAITLSATSLTVQSGHGVRFGPLPLRVVLTDGIDMEIILVEARTGDELQSITRAYEDVTAFPARAWDAGTQVNAWVTAGQLIDIQALLRGGLLVGGLVVPSNAPEELKDDADFVKARYGNLVQLLPGAADEQVIADVLAVAHDVLIAQGTVNIANSIILDADRGLRGVGFRTIISNGTNLTPAIKNSGDSELDFALGATTGITLSDLKIIGGSGAAAHGIEMHHAPRDLLIERIWTQGVSGHGILLNRCWSATLRNTITHTSGVDGILLENRCHANLMDHVFSASNVRHGVNINGGLDHAQENNPGHKIAISNGSAIQNNGAADLRISSGNGVTIRDSYFERDNNAAPMVLVGESTNAGWTRSLTLEGNTFGIIGGGGGDAVHLHRVLSVRSGANLFTSVTRAYVVGNEVAASGDARRLEISDADEYVASTRFYQSPVVTAFKSADQSINNSVTLTDDTHIKWDVKAGEVWHFTLIAFFQQSDALANGIQHRFTLPLNASGQRGITNWTGSGLNATAPIDSTSTITDGTVGVRQLSIQGRVVVGDTAGTVQWQWAQGTAHASNSTMLQGTVLRAQRVA